MAAHRCLVQAVVVGVNDSNVLYPACLQCYAKMLHNLQTDVWQCLRCNIRRREAELSWRYRLSVCVADTSATCHLSLFGGTLVPHFGCSANAFHQLLHTITPGRQGADEDLVLQALHMALVGRRYIFCLKTHTAPHQVTPTPPQPTPVCAQWGISRPPRLADLLKGVPASQRSGGKPGDFVAVQMIPVGADGDRASVVSVLEGLVCRHPDGSSVAERQGRDMSGAVPGKERGQSQGKCEPGNLPLANSCCNQMDQTGRQGAKKGVCAISSDDDDDDDVENHNDGHDDGGNVRLDQSDDHQSTASDQSSFDPYYSQSSGNSQAMLGFSCQSSMDQEFPSSFSRAVAGSMSGDGSHHKENPNCAWRSEEEMKGLGSSQLSDASHNLTGLDYLTTEDFCDTSHLSGQDPLCETSKFHKRTLSITHQHSSDSTDVLAVNSDNCNVNSPSQDRLHASAAIHKPSANKETTAEDETVLGSPHTAADPVWRGGIDRSSAGRREGRDHQPGDLYGQQKMTGGHYSQKMAGGHYSQKMTGGQNHSASFSTSLNDSCLLLAASHHHLEDSTMLHADHHHLPVEDSTMLPADHHHLPVEDSTMLPADHHHLPVEDSTMLPADHHHLPVEDSTMLPADHHHLPVEDSTMLPADHHHLPVEDSTMLPADHHHLPVEDSTMLHADHHHLEDSTMLPADHHHLHVEDSTMLPHASHHHLEDSTMIPADHHHLHVEDSTMLPADHHHLPVEDSTMLHADHHHLHVEDSTMLPHASHVSLKPAVTTSEETQELSSVRQAGRSVCRGEDEEGRESGGERGRESGGERGRESESSWERGGERGVERGKESGGERGRESSGERGREGDGESSGESDGESRGERGRKSDEESESSWERGGEKGGESAVSSVPRAVVSVEDMPFSEDLSAFLQVLAEDPSMSAVTSPPTSERRNVDKGRTDSLDLLMANAERRNVDKGRTDSLDPLMANADSCTMSNTRETCPKSAVEGANTTPLNEAKRTGQSGPPETLRKTSIENISSERSLMLATKQFRTPVACDGNTIIPSSSEEKTGLSVVRDTGPHRVGTAVGCSASPGGSPQCSSWVTSLPPREVLRRVSGQLPPQRLFEDLTFSPNLLEQVSPEAMPPENFPAMSLPVQNGEKCQDLCVSDQEMCTGEAEQVLPAERWEKHLCVCSRQGRGSQTSPRSPVGTESEKISVQIQRSSEKGQRKSCFHKNPRRQCLQGNRHRASSYRHPDGESSEKDANKTGSQNRCRLSKDGALISSSRCANKSGCCLASHRVRVQLPRDAGTAKSEQDCPSSRHVAFLQRSREVSPFSDGKHCALAMSDSRVEAMPESEDLDAFLSNLVPRNVQPSHSNTSVHSSHQEDRTYQKTPRHTASPVPVSQLAGIASSKKTHFKRSRHSLQKLNRKMSLRKSTSSDDALIWSGSQTDDSVLDCSADLFSQDTDEENGEETCASAPGSVERSSSYQHSMSDKMSQHCKSAMTVEPQEDSLRTVEESVSSIDNTAGTVSQKSYFNTPLSGEKVIIQRYRTLSKVSEEQRKVRFARKRRISSVRDMDLRLERYSSPQLESWHPCRPKPVPLTPRRSCLKECDGPEKNTCAAEIAGKWDSRLPLVEIQNVGGSSCSSGVHNVRLLHSSPLLCVQKEQCTPLQPSRRSEQFVSPLQEISGSQDLFSPCSTQRGQFTAGFQLTPEVQDKYVPQHSTGKTQRNAPALCSDTPANSQLSLFYDSDVLFDESENVSDDDSVSEWTSSLCHPKQTDMGGRERADSVSVALCRPEQTDMGGRERADSVSEALCRPEQTDMCGRERADSVCVIDREDADVTGGKSARLDLSSAWSMSPDLFSP